MLGPLLIRADANEKIGTGHVMRCLALAQAWKRHGGDVMFFGEIDDAIGARILKDGFGLCTDFIRYPVGMLVGTHGFDWVVVDGYEFGADYQQSLKDAGLHVLFIDDNVHAKSYCADLVLNQNIYAKDLVYPITSAGTRLLLGTDYALIREEFLRCRPKEKVLTNDPHVLVTMGGADPDNVTLKIIKALNDTSFHICIVVGGSNPHSAEILNAVSGAIAVVRVARNVQDMHNMMLWADFAISAGGSTCWELAFMGVPTLVTSIADNQRANVTGLTEAGIMEALGEDIKGQIATFAVDHTKRAEMRVKGQKLVDGLGADRVVEAMIGASA